MKKLFVILFIVFASIVHAKGVAQSSNSSGSVIAYDASMRVLIFSDTRNTISSSGEMLVCGSQFIASWSDNSCKDANGQNAWLLAEKALNGFTLTAFEYRLYGSSGRPALILYFNK